MKKKKTAKKTAKTQEKPELKHAESNDRNNVEGEFDFGGLPQRDIKKNLGCG
jgi:hypothetical protein